MNLEDLKELRDFAEFGVMRLARRQALQKLLDEHDYLVRELERVKDYVDVQNALLNEVRTDLSEARRSLKGLG